jgi:hypothetical protein
MKDMRSNAKFSTEIALDNTIPIESPVESFEKTLEKDDNEVPVRNKRQRIANLVMISLCILWMILLHLL